MSRRVLNPGPGSRIVCHHPNPSIGHYVLLYLFKRPEGAHVLLDLEEGVLVDVGQLNEGTVEGTFQHYEDWAKE